MPTKQETKKNHPHKYKKKTQPELKETRICTTTNTYNQKENSTRESPPKRSSPTPAKTKSTKKNPGNQVGNNSFDFSLKKQHIHLICRRIKL